MSNNYNNRDRNTESDDNNPFSDSNGHSNLIDLDLETNPYTDFDPNRVYPQHAHTVNDPFADQFVLSDDSDDDVDDGQEAGHGYGYGRNDLANTSYASSSQHRQVPLLNTANTPNNQGSFLKVVKVGTI